MAGPFHERADRRLHGTLVEPCPADHRLADRGPRGEPDEDAPRLLDIRLRKPDLLDRLPRAVAGRHRRHPLAGEDPAHEAPSAELRPQAAKPGQGVEEHREWPPLPALDELLLHDALPSRTAGAELARDRLFHEPLEASSLGRDAGSKLRDRLPQGRQLPERLAEKPPGQIEGAGAAHAPCRPADELLVDRLDEAGESRLRLEPCRGSAGGFEPVEAMNGRRLDPLTLELAPPVVADVGIA